MSQFSPLHFNGLYGSLYLIDPSERRGLGHVEVTYTRVTPVTKQVIRECQVIVYFGGYGFQINNVNHREALEADLKELVSLYLYNLLGDVENVTMEQGKIVYEN